MFMKINKAEHAVQSYAAGVGAWGPGAMGYIYNMLIIWQSYMVHIGVNDGRKRINWRLIWDDWQKEEEKEEAKSSS